MCCSNNDLCLHNVRSMCYYFITDGKIQLTQAAHSYILLIQPYVLASLDSMLLQAAMKQGFI